MKYWIAIPFLFFINLSFCQIPEEENIKQAYYVGHKAYEAIETLNYKLIVDYFKDTTNISYMIDAVESKRIHKDSIRITKDVMYNQETKTYEFMVYGAKYISTEDDWGLNDYYFVVQVDIDLRKEGRENQILGTKLIKDNDESALKEWWQNYMKSYKDPKYARNEIAEAYGMIPPPPPPPKTKDWF